MINCRRPSNRSSRLALPSGPSNVYFFSTASHGIRRRSAASASLARVSSFSFKSSRCLAASHSCGVTTCGVFIAVSSFQFGSPKRTVGEIVQQLAVRAAAGRGPAPPGIAVLPASGPKAAVRRHRGRRSAGQFPRPALDVSFVGLAVNLARRLGERQVSHGSGGGAWPPPLCPLLPPQLSGHGSIVIVQV